MNRHSFYPLFFLTILMVAVGQMTQTLYVPSIPVMAADLGVSSASLQAVMACYLIPYGLSQFIYGPLSDKWGRRPVLLTGMMVFLLGTLVIQLIPSAGALLVGSFIQGLGTGAAGAMSRTVMRDRYSGAELNRANSLVSMGVIFSPLLAPVLGGWLTEWLNWRAGYWFLFGFGAISTLAILIWFAETLPPARRQPLRVRAAYRHVLGNPRFQGNLLCLMATFAGLAVFEAAAGVLLGDVLGLNAKTVSVLFVLPLPGYLFGAWLSARLSFRLSQGRLMRLGIVFLGVGALIILLPGLFGIVSAASLVGGAAVYFIGSGILYPTATSCAIEPFPGQAGTAGAILGGMQNLGAGLVTLLAATFPMEGQLGLGAIMTAMVVLVALSFAWLRHHDLPREQLAT
ncbi:DHA1 family 2-module integral membrane pump EmrD-like MFS transporter [Aeromonas sp. BIGb0405]|jgi:MFS transporter, DHA1 family, 2-module integral membrane pump EmrD|uniref:multidrug efflux MFS transporter EmrD n=1 Tax=Aeromonas TaxID=642 RepID=UPI001CCDE78B|nr:MULTISPECIES: multidrug efflux MFS transporter EmrD [Aeromonas]MCS3457634.1 DHA1 family 2-module integral membrane pump EmrD-like MFS transporter [Aeromonas sp. BIGb0405]UBO72638.1 multidrug efflux MFS transporter EmrD [Aeromonas rivuli]